MHIHLDENPARHAACESSELAPRKQGYTEHFVILLITPPGLAPRKQGYTQEHSLHIQVRDVGPA